MIPEYSDLHAVIEQLQLLRLFLQRPVVEKQLAAFVLIVLTAAGFALLLWIALKKPLTAWAARHPRKRWWQRGVTVLRLLSYPLLCFAITTVVLRVFAEQGWQSALIDQLSRIFWLLLGYRIILAILYLLLGHEYMRRYHRLLLTPLFGLLSAGWLLEHLISLSVLSNFVVFRPFNKPITLGSLLVSPVTLYFLFYTSRAIQDLLQSIISPKTGADPSMIHAVLTISRYIVIMIGVSIIAVSLGANMSTLAVVSGGLSVGIGFGLQQIVANFLSGILLLFERTLRPGDVIDVNGEMGVVEKLSIRSTTMRTPNNIQIIVPNETLLTSAVRTYTKNNRLVRILVGVGVSYDSAPNQVRDILLEVAQQHKILRKDPKPVVFFQEFGASSIDFQLAVWLDEPMLTPKVTSELRFLIWDALAAHNIEIPFPQRDLHIRSGLPDANEDE